MIRISTGDLIAGLGAATKTFAPGGKHPRAATDLISRALQSSKWQLIGKSQWCCSANAAVHCTR